VITVFFVDECQDFLEWDIDDEGKVVACRPFQADIWVGCQVHNKDIKRGDLLDFTAPDGFHSQLIHPVDKVQQLEGAK
jgi:hypothetical protein